MRKLLFAAISGAWLISAGAEQTVIPAQNDLETLEHAESSLAEADARPLADPGRGAARFSAMQMLASARATVGDHPGATQALGESFHAFRDSPLPNAGDLKPDDVEYARSMLARYVPRPAIDAIVDAARGRQIVILNESHQLSQHRAFGMEVARALRRLGFRHLAMETLYSHRTADLGQRGYPLREDGWYSKDPVFGDFIRQSLRLGYWPVAYEQEANQDPKSDDWEVRIDSREESQAENLITRVLKKEPKARIFVYVGYSHVLKGSELVNGKPQIWMAERLKRKTGIDPLSIDETKMRVPLPGTRDRALIDAIFAETRADSVVLADRSNERSIYTFDASRVDLQVFHRPAKVVNGREDWLAMNGYRKPRDIPAELLPANGRRLIQAFVDGESADAVPMDQVLVTAGQPVPVLMLPKGKYRFAFLEKGGQSPFSGDGK
jgi:hypothetical protein